MIETSSEPPAPKFTLTVELRGGVVHLVVGASLPRDLDLPALALPVSPELARVLSSLLLGAAAAADPVGHQKILDEIGKLVATRDALVVSDVLDPGSVQH